MNTPVEKEGIVPWVNSPRGEHSRGGGVNSPRGSACCLPEADMACKENFVSAHSVLCIGEKIKYVGAITKRST